MVFLVFVAFLVLLTIFSAVGWVADSRDGADWAPTVGGRRMPRRL